MSRAQMSLHVELVDPDGEFDVVADGRDLRKWEALYESSYLTTPTSATQTAQVAHIAAQRLGLFEGPWEVFDARCVGVSYNRAEPVVADPTQQEATDASSAN